MKRDPADISEPQESEIQEEYDFAGARRASEVPHLRKLRKEAVKGLIVGPRRP